MLNLIMKHISSNKIDGVGKSPNNMEDKAKISLSPVTHSFKNRALSACYVSDAIH